MTEDGKVQTNVRLTEDRYDWLRRIAFDRGISQSDLIAELIDKERALGWHHN